MACTGMAFLAPISSGVLGSSRSPYSRMYLGALSALAQCLECREGGFGQLALELGEGARLTVAHEPPAGTVLTGSHDERAVELAGEGGQHPSLDMWRHPGGKPGMEV